jgi:hypothetical protein
MGTLSAVAKFEREPESKPIKAAAGVPTNPAAGVIATRLGKAAQSQYIEAVAHKRDEGLTQ